MDWCQRAFCMCPRTGEVVSCMVRYVSMRPVTRRVCGVTRALTSRNDPAGTVTWWAPRYAQCDVSQGGCGVAGARLSVGSGGAGSI